MCNGRNEKVDHVLQLEDELVTDSYFTLLLKSGEITLLQRLRISNNEAVSVRPFNDSLRDVYTSGSQPFFARGPLLSFIHLCGPTPHIV
jgi:hypothetical protein